MLCNQSYVYHSKDNLTNRDTVRLIVTRQYPGRSRVHWPKPGLTGLLIWTVKSAWLNSTKALVICGDFKEPTEIILNEFKKSNGIIFEATDDISSQVKELSLNLADGNQSISKYYGCYYHKTGGRPWIEDVQTEQSSRRRTGILFIWTDIIFMENHLILKLVWPISQNHL